MHEVRGAPPAEVWLQEWEPQRALHILNLKIRAASSYSYLAN